METQKLKIILDELDIEGKKMIFTIEKKDLHKLKVRWKNRGIISPHYSYNDSNAIFSSIDLSKYASISIYEKKD